MRGFGIFSALALGAAPASAQTGPSTATVVEIRIEGNESLSRDEILRVVPAREGGPLSDPDGSLSAEMVRSLYQGRGFLDSVVAATMLVWESSAALRLSVIEGPQYRFGSTRVHGLEALRDSIVLRELTYDRGQPYDRRELFKTQSRLYSLGLFRDVSIRASTTAARTAEIEIALAEQPMKWIKGGVGYGSEERERVSLILTHNNFLRRGYRLELLGTLSGIWLESRLELVNRYLFATRTESRALSSWRTENREGYELETVLGQFSLGRDLPYEVKGSVRWRLQHTEIFRVVPAIAATTPGSSETRSIDLAFNRDTSNDPFFPSRGSRLGLLLQRSGGLLGGDIHFYKTSLQGTVYRPLFWELLAAMTGRAGVAEAFAPSLEVPIFERFFTGGANSVRGYRERFVGPRDALGAPLGGDWVLGGSLELRAPLFWRLTAAAFVDGGQVSTRLDDALPRRWKYGAGGGLRVKTPVGPFRLDYGRKLNPDPGDADLWRIHISLGEAF